MLFKNKVYKAFIYIASGLSLAFFAYIYIKHSFRISPIPLASYIKAFVNLIPFKTISYYAFVILNPAAHTINTSIAVANLLKMTVVGIAAGFLLPQMFKKLNHFGWLVLCESIALVVLEAVQLVIKAGSFDIDDIILLIFGTAIGYVLLSALRKILRHVAKKPLTVAASSN